MALNEGLPLLEDAVLLHELNHRINNEFASAISVVSRAAARSSNNEVKVALTQLVRFRVAAVSLPEVFDAAQKLSCLPRTERGHGEQYAILPITRDLFRSKPPAQLFLLKTSRCTPRRARFASIIHVTPGR